ncbi:5018_t:CDS:1, partial [Acaulospora colombiana]
MSGGTVFSKYYIKGPYNPHEKNDYADPDLVAEQARELADIPFELVPGSVSEKSKARAKMLEKELRDAATRH